MEVEIKLPRPHPKQIEILNSKARFRVVKAGRRFGKSLLASIICIQYMLEGKSVGYITPTYSLSKLFFKELLDKIPPSIISSANKTDLEINLITGGSLKFFTGEALTSLRGRKHHFLIVDESAFIPELEDGWLNSMRPTLMDYSGSALFISTPNGLNYFMSLFNKGVNKEDGFESFHYTSYDNPYLDPNEIEQAKASTPKIVFEQEYLALESSNASNPFGDNIDKNVISMLSTKPAIIYSVDYAKYNDFSVITGLDEEKSLCHFQRFQLPYEKQIERLLALPREVPLYADSTGVGSTITELIQSKRSNVFGLTWTNQLKNEMVWKFVKDTETGNIKYNEETAREMKTYEYKYTKTGLYSFNSQSGFHDDIISSIIQANYYWQKVSINTKWNIHLI